jgi:hypothetical protein
MALQLNLVVTGTLTIDDSVAKVLAHLCRYDFQRWFYEKCSKEMTVEQIRDALASLRADLAKIAAAKQRALEAIPEPPSGE